MNSLFIISLAVIVILDISFVIFKLSKNSGEKVG